MTEICYLGDKIRLNIFVMERQTDRQTPTG